MPGPHSTGVAAFGRLWSCSGMSNSADPALPHPDAALHTCTLRELHGVIQVAMGWKGIYLYQFCLRSRRYGFWEVSAFSPGVTLAALKLRRGARLAYEYDLNILWRHEVRIEEIRLDAEPGKALPRCIAGDGACPRRTAAPQRRSDVATKRQWEAMIGQGTE